jgi:hypothetical protein
MKILILLLLVLLSPSSAFGQNQSQEHLVTFEWKYASRLYGALLVPSGYKEETRNYREGIVTYLHYHDSSYIILQRGGMFQIPMLQGPDYLADKTEDFPDRMMRSGRLEKTDLYWREFNFKRKKIAGRQIKFLDLFPPNIAFNRVPKERLELFNRALESFAELTKDASDIHPRKNNS